MTLPINCPSDGSSMSCIIGTQEIADGFLEEVNLFLKRKKIKADQLQEPAALEIVVAFLDDAISDRMRWARSQNSYVQALNKHFPWFSLFKRFRNHEGLHEVQCDDSHDFYIDVLDKLEIELNTLLDSQVPEKTWDVWSLTRLGKDTILIRGEDYRIMDWERRMANGEFKGGL